MVDAGILLTRRSSSASLPSATGEKPKKPSSVPLMALHPDWIPHRRPDGTIAPEGQLWEFVERLSQFRREGKNRRDNKTGTSRLHSSSLKGKLTRPSFLISLDTRLLALFRHCTARTRPSPRRQSRTDHVLAQVVEYTPFTFDKAASSFFAPDRMRTPQVRL
jgi:hypothetical protein